MRFRLRNNRAPRDQACARREARRRMGFSRCARGGGFDRFQCLLRLDSAPLYFFGTPRDQACARREALKVEAIRGARGG